MPSPKNWGLLTPKTRREIMNFLEIIRGLVRPLIALGFAGALIYLVVAGEISTEQFLPIVVMVATFYFTERAINKRKEG